MVFDKTTRTIESWHINTDATRCSDHGGQQTTQGMGIPGVFRGIQYCFSGNLELSNCR